tara:strand:- start:14528 stop:15703 length:1176 start_codon:yes stop_codon:yes gene_type:complete
MNILLIASDLGLGGAQQIVINLANELVNQRHKVWVFDVQPEHRVEGMISRFDIKVNLISRNYNTTNFSVTEKLVHYGLNKLSKRNNFKKHRFKKHVNNLNSILSSNRIDYINSHNCWADFYVYKELKKLHSKWIISLHASYNSLLASTENNNKYSNQVKNTITAASKVIYIHDKGLQLLEKKLQISVRKAKKIFNGIPDYKKPVNIKRKDFEIKNDDFVILCASRASKSKGWYELAKCVLALKMPKIKLIFAGDGEILEDLKNKYSKCRSTIKFLGFQKQINSLISISDIICLPSYTEALPTILIESIFHNKPVIATNVGETANIIENKKGRCGVLINANKGAELVRDLKKEIIKITNTPPNFEKEAFEEAKKLFSSKKMVQNYINYFVEN